MIKASELRLNNWVGTLTGYAQCIDVLCDSVNTKRHEGIPLDMLEPIPLTDDMLQSAGFEHQRSKLVSRFNRQRIRNKKPRIKIQGVYLL